jgi:hypothetical protein
MTTTSILDMQQAQGESQADYVARLKGLSIIADEAVRDAQVLQEHCQALYKASLKAGAGREVLVGRFDAIRHAAAQMARAKKRRDDVEYALFEALQVWDGE